MDLQQIADCFYNITRFGINILTRDGIFMCGSGELTFPESIQDIQRKQNEKLIQQLQTLKEDEYTQVFVSSLHLNYILVRSSSGFDAILGPYAYKDIPADIIHQMIRSYSLPASLYAECQDLYQRLPMNVRPVQIAGNLILTFLQNGVVQGQLVDAQELNTGIPAPSSKKYMENQTLRNIDYQYAKEDQIRDAIRMGDTPLALQALATNSNRFEYRSNGYNLWHMQHQVTVMGTVMRIAAREGGVLPYTIHHISNNYFFQIQKLRSEAELEMLLVRMIKDYSRAVQHAKTNSYSPIVQTAIAYLHIYYSKHVSIEKIAQFIPCHPNYLCQCFKKETNQTVIQKLTDIRLNHALVLLQDPTMPITTVGSEVGFESHSHFSSLFRKRYDCSCSEWRKNYLSGNIRTD